MTAAVRSKILFMHAPKAAGTSVAAHLRRALPTAAALPGEPERLADRAQWERYREFDLVHGHCGYDFARFLGPAYQVLTNFRHPVARVVSLYDYWRYNGNTAELIKRRQLPNPSISIIAPYMAKHMAFPDFIRSTNTAVALYTHDAHARQLLENWWTPRSISAFDLYLLKRRIAQMPWFYICEYRALSEAWFARQFGFGFDGLPDQNMTNYASEQRTVPTPADVEFILSANKADLAIYLHAVKIMNDRMAKPAAG